MKIINLSNKNKKMQVTSVTVDRSVYDKLQKISEKHGVSKQRLVSAIVENFIDDVDFN